MTLPSDAMPQSPLDLPAAEPAAVSPTRPFYWSVRRELWENRSIYIAPLAASGVVLLGFLISAIGLPHRRLATLTLPPAKQAVVIGQPYHFAAVALILTMIVVAMFYCLGALHGERRDRSILFWKSLPVSDLVTVLAKATVPLVVLPLVVFGIIPAVQLIMLLLSTIILVTNGVSAAVPWTLQSVLEGPVVLLYGLATLTLWLAPVYGWLLLISGWARRGTFLWAVLPPLALCLLEKIAFNTTHLAALLQNRLMGSYADAFVVQTPAQLKMAGGIPIVGLTQLDPAKFLSSPGLWIGLAVAGAFFAGAVWLRRYREPI